MEHLAYVIVAAIVGSVSAYVMSYLRKSGELRAVGERLATIERCQADIAEAAKVRWTRRADLTLEMHAKLLVTINALMAHVGGLPMWNDRIARRTRIELCALEYAFARATLFLPEGLREQGKSVIDKLRSITVRRALLAPKDEAEWKRGCLESRQRLVDGDVAREVSDLEDAVRKMLDVEIAG